MEPLRTPFEKYDVTLLKADSSAGLQEQIDLFINDKGKDTIYRIIVKINTNNYYDEEQKCMVYCAAILYKFIFPHQLFEIFSRRDPLP